MDNPSEPERPQEPIEQSPGAEPQPQYSDWREMRQAERDQRREERRAARGGRSSSWFWGAILILVGLALLVQNLTGSFFVNWWALFILIPAIGAFAAAWGNYQTNGRLTRNGRSSLIGGAALTILAVIFLFNLSFSYLWPVLLILGGLSVLLSELLPD
ncbi:MAG TPA: hypothetical protein VMT46_04825 [Anaerolineaceae bacterium]|nr:hypothetical protein [Anaerolineaceae bacterium]